jgi:hypothetical protein
MHKSIWFRLLIFVTLMGILSGCEIPLQQVATPATSDADMATRVAKILTEMPQPTSALPTGELPPVVITEASPATSEPVVSTNTPVLEATQAPVSTEAPTQAPAEATATPEATTAPAEATATATSVPATPTAALTLVPAFTPPADNPRTKLGDPSWSDAMDDGMFWPTGPDSYTSIDFGSGMLKLTGLTTTDGWRLATTEKLNNFYLEMKINTGTCTGSDRYGIMFRVPVSREANKGYLFGFTCDGKYSLREWDATIGDKGLMTTHVNWTTSSAIQTGSNKSNTIGIMAVGDRLILYANGALLTEVKDATFTEGSFGLFVGARETTNFVISVDEASYWKNPTP